MLKRSQLSNFKDLLAFSLEPSMLRNPKSILFRLKYGIFTISRLIESSQTNSHLQIDFIIKVESIWQHTKFNLLSLFVTILLDLSFELIKFTGRESMYENMAELDSYFFHQ